MVGRGRVILFTDGSSYYKTQMGGWGFVALNEAGEKIAEGHRNRLYNTTVNQMELRAIHRGLEWCNANGYDEVLLYSDSEYAIMSITVWWRKWIKNKYANPKNKNLILKVLEEVVKLRNFETQHVRGHQKKHSSLAAYWNNYVDGLCRYNRTE